MIEKEEVFYDLQEAERAAYLKFQTRHQVHKNTKDTTPLDRSIALASTVTKEQELVDESDPDEESDLEAKREDKIKLLQHEIYILGQEVEAAEQLSKLKERQSKVREPDLLKSFEPEIFRGKSDKEIGEVIENLSPKNVAKLLKYYIKGA